MCPGNIKGKPNSQLFGSKIRELNIFCWNIHGKVSKLVGDKFLNTEFLHSIQNSHVLGLVELHTESIPNIPGFKLIKQKIRKNLHKGPKIAGGLAVFARADIAHMIKHVDNDSNDSIWVKIKKEETGENNDIYIGTIYLSPANKSNDEGNSSLESFFQEVSNFKEKGSVFIQGDFNAYTNTLPDYLISDKTDNIFGI